MKYLLQLSGLHCDACKKIVEKRLARIEGAESVEVDLKKQTVLLSSNSEVTEKEIKSVLDDTDYKIESIKGI